MVILLVGELSGSTTAILNNVAIVLRVEGGVCDAVPRPVVVAVGLLHVGRVVVLLLYLNRLLLSIVSTSLQSFQEILVFALALTLGEVLLELQV